MTNIDEKADGELTDAELNREIEIEFRAGRKTRAKWCVTHRRPLTLSAGPDSASVGRP